MTGWKKGWEEPLEVIQTNPHLPGQADLKKVTEEHFFQVGLECLLCSFIV